MEKNYITFSLQDFILLGRKDALTGGKKDVQDLLNKLSGQNRKYIIKRVQNYLLGYRMGIVELSLKNIHENPSFNTEKCILITSKKQLPTREMKQLANNNAKKLVLGR